ncbi:auxilin-like protein 1 isoform X2 [Corylus avellana]|uniref:auxilin-like protein 1 isoform X2 n=1 Tax=Corylus avellana TaxID=13451 RepID=UPI00286A0201|nr:auxilin-like protein 1 isoform X2 [Corylus avellana]
MEYQVSSATLSKKLSNGHSLRSKSVYDGVLSAPSSKLRAPSFSSRVQDYGEIFGGPEASRASTIPFLDVPALNGRSISVDVRSSKLDYSTVFGGFGGLDFAVSYEELVSEPKKRKGFSEKARGPGERATPLEGADPSDCQEKNQMCSNEATYESFDGAKKFSMSYNKINQGGKNGTNGTTHIAQLHAVPGYTRLIDEITPSHMTGSNKPVSSAVNDAYLTKKSSEGVTEGVRSTKAVKDLSAGGASKKKSKGGVALQNKSDYCGSDSIDMLFGAYEYGHGHSKKVSPSSSPLPNSCNTKGDSESSMASKFGVSGIDNEGAGCASSPPYFDEEVDANSFAAASVAALKKAIEEAQASMKIVKESMARKKEGLQNCGKLSSNHGLKDKQRKEGKVTDKVNRSKAKNNSEIYEKEDAPLQVSAGTREQNGMRAGHPTPDFRVGEKTFGNKAALREACERELKSTQADHRQEAAKVWDAGNKANRSKGKKDLEICESEDDPVQVSAGTREQSGMRAGHLTPDFEVREKSFGTQAALGETCERVLRSTQADHMQEAAKVRDAVDKANRSNEKKDLEICEREDDPMQVSAGTREQNGMTAGHLTPDFGVREKPFGTKAALGETCESVLRSTQADHKQEAGKVRDVVEQIFGLVKRGIQKVRMSEFEQADNIKKEGFENTEEFRERTNTIKEAHKQDDIKRKINAVKGAVESEEHEGELKSAQQVHDQEENEKRLRVAREQEDSEKKVKAIHEQEIYEEKLTDFQDPINYEGNIETQGFEENEDMKGQMEAQEWVENEKKVKETCEEEEQEDAHYGEETEKRLDKVHEHPRIEMRFNDFHDEEENGKSLKENGELEGNEKPQEAGENETLLKGSAYQSEEKDKRQKETYESIETERTQIEIDQSAEDEKKFEVVQEALNYKNNLEIADDQCKQDESENPNKNQEASRHIENDEDVELILEVAAHEKNGSTIEVNQDSIKQEESGKELQPVKDEKTVKVAEEALYHENNLNAADDICKQDIRENLSENQEACIHIENDEYVEFIFEVAAHEENGSIIEVKNGSTIELNKAPIEQEENGIIELETVKDEKTVKVVEEALYNENNIETIDDGCKQDESENLSESQESSRHVENDKYAEATLEVSSHEENRSTMKVNTASFEHKENGHESEAVKKANDMEDKEILETVGFPQDTFRLTEMKCQMADTIETTAFDLDGVDSVESEMSFGQKQNEQHAEEHKEVCNLGRNIEELDSELGKIYENIKEVEVAADQEEDQKDSMSFHEERWVDGGNKVKAAQLPSMFEGEGESVETAEEIKITRTTENYEQNHQSNMTMEEKESNDTLQKEVELEKQQYKKIDEVKKREREREREKMVVERAIREARERAFAEARERAERAAAERASVEARRRVMAEAREKLGKTSAEANEKSPAEKSAMEAKLKAERAAVERATAEARERALERAISEKFSGASRDDGRRQSFSTHDPQQKGSCPPSNSTYPNSSSSGGMSCAPHSTEKFDGANGESAERSKAGSERHQRIVERAAKALAEKNMRDFLAQKEQADRNRLAEALDADVKRWSSGKEGNLRALLSTLQYILGPDSGWQPVPLTDIITTSAVKKAYRKATLFVHPDKLQQRGASIQQKYTCEKVFDLLKEAWNRFNAEER